MSHRPNRRSTSPKQRSIDPWLPTSKAMGVAAPFCASIVLAVCVAASRLRSETMTRWLAAASCDAIAAPTPAAPPVTRATLLLEDFANGHKVGEIARTLYAGGILRLCCRLPVRSSPAAATRAAHASRDQLAQTDAGAKLRRPKFRQ